MATISYTSNFNPTHWLDNHDRVKAFGPNGFNERFDDITQEFQDISRVIGKIGTAIENLTTGAPPEEVTTTLTPALVSLGTRGWDHVAGSAEKPPNATDATGMMSVALPQDSRIRSIRAIGSNAGQGFLTIALTRQGFGSQSFSEPVISVPGSGAPFDTTNNNAPAGELGKVDNEAFRYYLLVELAQADPAANVTLSGVQITHIAE